VSTQRPAPKTHFAGRVATIVAAVLALVAIDHLDAGSALAVLWTRGGLVIAAVAIRWVR
jgi:hypothetical protein